MQKTTLICIFFVSAILVGYALSINMVHAQIDEEEDPAVFIIAKDAPYIGASGWYAGYLVVGQSGTYTLNISANGPERLFPISNVKIIAAISTEAKAGGLSALSIEGVQIATFTQGVTSYYGAQGGPFSEPDYYGYNDQYVIPQLTYQQIHFPNTWYQITVTVNFASSATENSKVMFLCYGTDSAGKSAKTPFSQGTLFVVPEYITPIMGISSCFAAYAVFRKRKFFTKKS